jgi:hypothetical protein
MFSGFSRMVTRPLSETGFLTDSGQAILRLDGNLIERWAAKTFLNVVLAAIPHSREKSPLLSISGVQIAEEVFTGKPFPGRHGFYGLPLGTNLMGVAGFNRSLMTLTILSMDVNHRKQGQAEWKGPYRMPAFLYIVACGFEFLLHANLTALCNADFDALVAPRWNDPAARAAIRHPQGARFDVPQLDGPRGSQPLRIVGFTWS